MGGAGIEGAWLGEFWAGLGAGKKMDEEDAASVFDGLPFDCLVCICEYLSPSDLCRFGAACKVILVAVGRPTVEQSLEIS